MKISVIGGGSYTWAVGFVRQFVESDLLNGAEIVLMDISDEALELVGRASRIYNRQHGSPLRLSTTPDLDEALRGSDFVLVSISTGGLQAFANDLAIPEKYGIWQAVGNTVGPGGWSWAVRNIPVFHDLAQRMSRLCPDAWLLNVTNPLTTLTRVPQKYFGIRTIGMCPGLEMQARCLATLAGAPNDSRVDYVAAGIDHGSWFTSLYAGGMDVIKKLKELGYYRSDDRLPSVPMITDPMTHSVGSRAVFALWREIGYMPGICDRHHCENHPWFLVNETGQMPFGIERTTIAEREGWLRRKRQVLEQYVASEKEEDLGELGHGDDPILEVVESLQGYRSFLYGSNYMNVGQIPGLPDGAVVETRVLFDGAGVHPLCSPLPDVLMAMVAPHVYRQEAVLEIALNGTFDQLVALVLTDPLCSRLELTQCRQMMRELLDANRRWIVNPKLLDFDGDAGENDAGRGQGERKLLEVGP